MITRIDRPEGAPNNRRRLFSWNDPLVGMPGANRERTSLPRIPFRG